MQAKVRKWGNSLAVRIPRSLAVDVDIAAGTTVDISSARGEVVIRPARRRRYDLTELLSKINRRNVHREISTGKRVGHEAW